MARLRYEIVGTLTTTSPLCIRSGDTWKDHLAELPRSQRDLLFRPGQSTFPEDNDVALIVRDYRGLPYLPASGLKGAIGVYLRRLAAGTDWANSMPGGSKEVIDLLLGEESPSEERSSQEGGRPENPTNMSAPRQYEERSTAGDKESKADDGAEEGGTASEREETGGRGGCVLFEDAFICEKWLDKWRRGTSALDLGGPWWSARELTYVDSHVSIDRRTRTAADAMLLYTEVVPPGIAFRLALTLDHENEELAKLLLSALRGFNLPAAKVPIQLGSETSNGWGRLRWSLKRPDAVVRRRLPSGPVPSNELLDFGRSRESDPKPAPRRVRDRSKPEQEGRTKSGITERSLIHLTARIELHFDGPFLVNDPSQCKGAGDTQGSTEDDNRADTDDMPHPEDAAPRGADHYPRLTADGRAFLAASSFRGPFRSQIERIVRTLAPEAPVGPHHHPRCIRTGGQLCDSVEHLHENSPIRKLLGTTGHESVFWCSDFIGTEPDLKGKGKIQKQEMVAIDRWTGGAAEGLKYDVEYIERCVLKGTLRVDLVDTHDGLALAGLLALALWDLCEGDITFGFGASKGFGECRAKIISLRILGLGRNRTSAWEKLVTDAQVLADKAIVTDEAVNASWNEAINGHGNKEVWDPLLDQLLTHLRSDQGLARWTKREPAKLKAVSSHAGAAQ